MPPAHRTQRFRFLPRRQNRSALVVFTLILLWSITMGWGLSLLAQSSPVPAAIAQARQMTQSVKISAQEPDGAIDEVPENLKLAQNVYLENCATCHVGVPPAVLPTETWKTLLLDPNHYGIQITPLLNPFQQLAWNYLRTFSRGQFSSETLPYRLSQSRFFKSLHPGVTFSQPVSLKGCVSCHPGASQYHYRTLSSDWQSKP